MTGASTISCTNSTSEKLEKAKDNSVEAQADLDKANADYLADVENYRKISSERIIANEKSIAEFNQRTSNDKAEAKLEYKKKIAELEQKNSDMKKKLDDYKADGKDKWQDFKTEFNHDMDELGKAFKDLTVKNTK
jgi:hypothetical protein